MSEKVTESGHILCKICGAKTHSISMHLRDAHAELSMSTDDYLEKYPGELLLSPAAEKAIEERRLLAKKKAASGAAAASATVSAASPGGITKEAFHDLFGLGKVKAALAASGKPIMISVLGPVAGFEDMVPDVDPNYVFNLDILKTLLLGVEMNIPVYLWGHAGTGKTTMLEQICARTKRPLIRVQHTANMEEEHIVGGWRLRDGQTVFELGPLAMAMRFGWAYMADEYDFSRPEVSSVYQAVFEGKPLVIKEADLANRVIRPHPNFRIFATGNTNGQGDESGLYQGTNLQNSANYERFGIVEKMPYMEKALEERLVQMQADIPMADSKKLVEFATKIRSEYDGATIGTPISPRSLIFAGRIGFIRNSYRLGLEKAYINRLSSTDREVAAQVAQRVFA